jgi:hypothetical protein
MLAPPRSGSSRSGGYSPQVQGWLRVGTRRLVLAQVGPGSCILKTHASLEPGPAEVLIQIDGHVSRRCSSGCQTLLHAASCRGGRIDMCNVKTHASGFEGGPISLSDQAYRGAQAATQFLFLLYRQGPEIMATQFYMRPTNPNPLSPGEKAELLREYFAYYEDVAQQAPELLNVKLERAAVAGLLDEVGALLLQRSRQLALAPGPMREFLQATEPPECVRERLPADFRAFCLALNALKQWVSAVLASSKTFARKAREATRCSYRALVAWLDERDLGY